jgi:hypothetical protein
MNEYFTRRVVALCNLGVIILASVKYKISGPQHVYFKTPFTLRMVNEGYA